MKDMLDLLTNGEKAKLYKNAKLNYANQNDERELIKEAHKIFLTYVNYFANKYAKLNNKDDEYAGKIQEMYISKYIFKMPINPIDAKRYKSDLNYFRRNERLGKVTEYYMIIQDSYNVDEMKKNLDLIYDMYAEDLKNDN